nr:MAG TPA: minor capsid protein 2 [Caudoviricetes sp.]
MQITANAWNEYITRLSRLNRKAGQLMREYIGSHGTENTADLIAYAYGLVTKYGEGSAELACQMYDALAEAANAGVPAAEPAVPADYGEVARMVNATKSQNPANLPNGVSRLVKRAGADTTLKNAVRDGAEWAWVPHGDTCPFCITLASNGWQKASSKVLKGGHAEHIHANCDCEFAIRFDHSTTVAGYDPEKYLKQYRDAGGDINKMRRIDYAARKDAINAQKRAAYAERQKYLISAAERGKGPITKITDSVINDFPAVKVDWFTEDQNKQFRSLHKELLQTSRDKNNCFETAFIVSGDLSRKTIVFGDETTISIPPLSTGLNSWILHNHPRNSSFSIEDIAAVTIPGYQGITIAKNNGGLEILTKSPNCDNIRLQNDVRRFLIRKPNKISDSDAQKMISKWVEKGWAKWLIVEKQK